LHVAEAGGNLGPRVREQAVQAVAGEVRAKMEELKKRFPAGVDYAIVYDTTPFTRESIKTVIHTLIEAFILVAIVVMVFLQSWRTTLIPLIAVPVSLIGTFGGMYLLGYSLNNLSLMAMAIAAGFVVDDAIIVLENISRHIEAGMSRIEAALQGAREVGFTVVSMSLSLIAVFIPILLMGGIVGRLFREFAVTLTIAVTLSLLISLSVTPMMCSRFLRPQRTSKHGWLYRFGEWAFDSVAILYERTLRLVLRHQFITIVVLIVTVCLNICLFAGIPWTSFNGVPKGLFPQQDVGRIGGAIQAEQDISSVAMREKMREFVATVMADPDVSNVVAFTGGGGNTTNTGRMFVVLKPWGERSRSAQKIKPDLQQKVSAVAMEESRAQTAKAESQANFAALQSEMLTKLRTRNAVSEIELLRIRSEAEVSRATVRGLVLTMSRIEQDRIGELECCAGKLAATTPSCARRW
jgi:multidrug efflux pump